MKHNHTLKDSIEKWWEGELQAESIEEMFDDNHQEQYKRHWTSSLIRFFVTFWLSHWKAFLPIIAGAIVALFIHFDSKSSGESKKEKTHKVGSMVAVIHET